MTDYILRTVLRSPYYTSPQLANYDLPHVLNTLHRRHFYRATSFGREAVVADTSDFSFLQRMTWGATR